MPFIINGGLVAVGVIRRTLVETAIQTQLLPLGAPIDWTSSSEELTTLCGTNGGMAVLGKAGRAWEEF